MERQENFLVATLMAQGQTRPGNYRGGFSSWRFTTLAALFVVGVCCIRVATAQEQTNRPILLRHQPTETHQLPSAGTLMPIAVQLENSSDVDIKIRLVGSRDGRFMDIAFPMGVLNSSDRPTYTIQLPSPVAAMTYQFITHQRSGDLTLSDKFIIKRNCVQNFKVEIPEGIPSAEYRKEMANLVANARSLERDTQNLDTAIKLLDALKKDVPE